MDGDNDSLGWVIFRFQPLLMCQARYRLGDKLRRASQYHPEDLVHDVWIRVMPKLGDLRREAPGAGRVLLAYLSRTLQRRANELYDEHVRRKPAPASSDDEDGDLMQELQDRYSGVITRVGRAEATSELEAALDSLDEMDRELIVLRGIEGLEMKQIAVMLRMKPNTLSVRYARARKHLRERCPDSATEDLADP